MKPERKAGHRDQAMLPLISHDNEEGSSEEIIQPLLARLYARGREEARNQRKL